MIDDTDLQKFESHIRFIKEIESIDLTIKPFIIPHPKLKRGPNDKWWDKVILKKGGPIYVSEMKTLYGIDIELA